MSVLTITLLAAILLAVALPLAVYGLVPARAGVDARRLAHRSRPARPVRRPPRPRSCPAPCAGSPAPAPARGSSATSRSPVSARPGRSHACCASSSSPAASPWLSPSCSWHRRPACSASSIAAAVVLGVYLLPDVVVGSRARERQDADPAGARRRARRDHHLDRGRTEPGDGRRPRRRVRQGTAGAGADPHRAGHARRVHPQGGVHWRSPSARRSPTCAGSPARSCRPTSTGSRSATWCAARRRSCAASAVSAPRSGP